MKKYRCKMAGRDVRDINGNILACLKCAGIIVKDKFGLRLEKPVGDMLSPPRKPIAPFNCPLGDPNALRDKNLVEEASS